MSLIHDDKSYIYPEDVKTADEGKGKLYASIGKEIDEHDAIGKLSSAGAFVLKTIAIVTIISSIGSLLFFIFVFIILGGASSKSVHYDGSNMRIITIDNEKEYQIKDENGEWFKVDGNVYEAMK